MSTSVTSDQIEMLRVNIFKAIACGIKGLPVISGTPRNITTITISNHPINGLTVRIPSQQQHSQHPESATKPG